jgi:ribosome-associated heat shock protein Hsp15
VADTLRLDKFLWFARIVKSRAQAQMLAENGRIRIGGRLIEKAHAPVRPGEILSFAQRGRVRAIRIERLPSRRVSAAETPSLYCELTSEGSRT